MRSAMVVMLTVASLGAQQLPAGRFSPSLEDLDRGAEAASLLNAARLEQGLAPLRSAPPVDLLAYQHARELAARGRVTHYSYLWGVSTASRVRLAFPQVHQFAENVASNRSVAQLHAALLRSELHRRNRMDPTFTHVGIGVTQGDDGQLYMTEVFVAVGDDAQLQLAQLYTDLDREQLPRDEPRHGEIAGETVSVGAPGDDNPQYWTNRGIEAFDAGRYGEAIDHFQHALRIAPGYRYARFDLGRALLAAGRADEAHATLTDLLADDPNDLDARASLGAVEMLRGDYPAAERALRAVIESRQRDANAWYNLGLALELQRRAAEAERAYAQAVHLDPSLQAARIALQRLRH